jgi:hypothetical protein
LIGLKCAKAHPQEWVRTKKFSGALSLGLLKTERGQEQKGKKGKGRVRRRAHQCLRLVDTTLWIFNSSGTSCYELFDKSLKTSYLAWVNVHELVCLLLFFYCGH